MVNRMFRRGSRLGAIALGWVSAFALSVTSFGAPQPTADSAPTPPRVDGLPPMLRLGARAGAMSQRIPAANVVLIAEDGESFLYAVSHWRLTKRFPVLIDDGSLASAQRIARFVRAYKPSSILRVRTPDEPANAGAADPDDRQDRAARMRRAIASAWTIRDEDEPIAPENLGELWKQLGFEPFGVVVADAEDPTWPAAVALAAGHGQPVVWLTYPPGWGAPGNIGGSLTADQLRELNEAIVQRLRADGRAFEGLGNDIDAITLCYDGPTKVMPSAADPGVHIALSDCIGRVFDEQQRPTGARWAWCGQIVGGGGTKGSESSAAYEAMCSLFLRPRMAWLFDGYEDKEPWNAFDMTRAATALEREGVRNVLDDNGRQGLDDFRRRAAGIGWPWRDREAADRLRTDRGEEAVNRESLPPRRGIDAELVMVNTSGNPEFFDLRPGQGRVGDLPFLRHPAAIYFVHSWSAANLANNEFLAARWRQRGAYAYCGSVHEPFLQGFVPSPIVAARLAAGVPWGAAVRHEQSQPWKVLCLGDPLMLVRGNVPRLEGAGSGVTFPGLSDLHAEVAGALRERKFERALRLMGMLGRDRDAARLLAALIAEEEGAAQKEPAGAHAARLLTPDAALQGLLSAYFDAEPEVFARVLDAALERAGSNREWGAPALIDTAWHAMWPRLDFLSPGEIEVLGRCVRSSSRDRDAAEFQRAARGAR
ncbi:MAG: hypothetical protein KF768_09015 [Phycisphaeraceae bacterium]|nr:hypothetical protein [Phycisphaeraceae bacterium]